MARKTKNRGINFIAILFALILGACAGFACLTYFTLPETEELYVGEELFYSQNETTVSSNPIAFNDDQFSVHFLELGNKYTGDCTYIKYGDVDILIDCGSKSNSVDTVSTYLNQYVTDNTLEYVIVTHAHTDHYAGFAATKNSIFDLYNCEIIIDFGAGTNKTASDKTYANYIKNRNKEIEESDAEYFDASTVQKGTPKTYEIDVHLQFEILYNEFADNHNASSENDYSVCTLFTFDNKQFLFTGDLENEKGGEEKLIKNNPSIQNLDSIELFKAGHHGSKTSTSEILLKNIKPKCVCVCCCAGSSEYTKEINNQFPTKAFIDRVTQYTTEIYVTSLCVDYKNNQFTSFNGNIVVFATLNVEKVNVTCSHNSTTLTQTDWYLNRAWGTKEN